MKSILLNFLLILIFPVIHQAQNKSLTIPECNSVEEKNDEYFFKVNGEVYADKDLLYICNSDFPVHIDVFEYVETGPDVEISHSTSWKKATKDSNLAYRGTIEDGVIKKGSKETVECEFDNGSKKVKLKLNVRYTPRAKFTENSNTEFAMDPWHLGFYLRLETDKAPVKLIQSDHKDYVDSQSKPSSQYEKILLEENNSGILIAPKTISSQSKEEIELDITSVPSNYRYLTAITGCTDVDMVVYKSAPQVFDIDFYLLCESDDDVSRDANAGPITSPLDVCVFPGNDMSLDEHENLPLGSGTRWVNSNDDVALINDIKHVVAGSDLTCQTTARPNNVVCPNVPSYWGDVVSKVLNIYSVAEATVNLPLNLTSVTYNYDSYIDDSKFSNKDELEYFRFARYGDREGNPSHPEGFMPNDIIGKDSNTAGFAITFSDFFFYKSSASPDSAGNGIAHEIGHALFGFRHTTGVKGQTDVNDPTNMMNLEANPYTDQIRVGQIYFMK